MRYFVKNKIVILFTFAILFIIASCEDAKYDTIGSRVYLAESSSLSYESKKVTVAEEGSIVSVTPRTGQIATEDMEITLGLNPSALEVFNTKSGTNYKSLPEGSFSFDQKTVVIKKGELVAPTVKVTIEPLTKEMINSGDQYALPVAITSVSGGQQTLEGGDVMIYVIDQVIITSAPVITGTKPIILGMRQDYTVTQWSVEMRINMSELGDGVTPGVGYPGPPSYQNQVIFTAGPGNDIAEDGEIYIRFGDGPIPGNILQIKTQGTQVNCATKFKNKQWYHLAFVCDGVKLTVYVNGNIDATLDLPRKPLRLVKDSFGVCNGTWMVTEAIVSELRFWTTAISQSQIQNNEFAINPKTEGLEGYWKLNEGSGTEYNDATGHGNKATAPNGVVRWEEGIRSDGK